MTDTPRILVFAGSARRDSWNRKLAALGAEAVRRAGGEATLLELRDHPMPIYDEDGEREQGVPAPARAFREQVLAHDALLVACPEYNSSITPLLKNAIDWATRAPPGVASLAAFQHKVAALLAASPGALGGLRGLVTVRSILGNIGVLVLPGQLAVGRAHEAFDAEGRLKDGKQAAAVEAIAAELVAVTRRLGRRAQGQPARA
jgi:chromate reductase, NAD(P)H dehydrogenase (quinone)